MSNNNEVRLIGNLGRDPELRFTTTGKAVCNFSMATEDKWGDGADQKKTTWHNVVVWGKPAEWATQALHKGAAVLVLGRIDNRSYDDKNGVKKTVTEIIAHVVRKFAPATTAAGEEGPPESAPRRVVRAAADDDIPF